MNENNQNLQKYTPTSLQKLAKQMAVVNKLISNKKETLEEASIVKPILSQIISSLISNKDKIEENKAKMTAFALENQLFLEFIAYKYPLNTYLLHKYTRELLLPLGHWWIWFSVERGIKYCIPFLFENDNITWSVDILNSVKNTWPKEMREIIKYISNKAFLKSPYSDFNDYILDWEEISSKNKHWSVELIDKYKDKWDWSKLSANSALPWSIELIDKYKDKWDWSKLSANSALPWSVELIDKYKDKWDWYKLSANSELPWSIELIDKYQDRWSWYNLSDNTSITFTFELIKKYESKWVYASIAEGSYNSASGLVGNNSVKWTFEMVAYFISVFTDAKNKDKYDEYIYQEIGTRKYPFRGPDWKYALSSKKLPWSILLIDTFKHIWDWKWLSSNTSLSWSFELIDKYADKWDWSKLSANSALPWSVELLEKFIGRWDWIELAKNKELPWTQSFINKFESRWAKDSLIWHKNISFSDSFFEKHKNKWNWNEMSQNESLPWTENLIAKYADKWNFKYLSCNEALPWTENLIAKYADKWNFKYLSCNEALPWTESLIEKYVDKWNWNKPSDRHSSAIWNIWSKEYYPYSLSGNKKLPWSIDFITKYSDRLDKNTILHNKAVFENAFLPYLNDGIVDEIMEKIREKGIGGMDINEWNKTFGFWVFDYE